MTKSQRTEYTDMLNLWNHTGPMTPAQLERLEELEELDARPRQMTFDQALVARNEAMKLVEDNAGPSFNEMACEFVLGYLRRVGEAPSEEISMACSSSGIKPRDDRAFGPVYMKLARSGVIVKVGSCRRKRGHGTTGGNIWSISPNAEAPKEASA